MRRAILAMWLALGALGWGQAPSQVALILPSHDPEAMALGHLWAHLRDLTPEQIVYVRLHPEVQGRVRMSAQQFTDTIWDPVQEALDARGLDGILAWVYGPGIPTRVDGEGLSLSLTGITWARNRIPAAHAVQRGTWRSPLFSAPQPGRPAPALRGLDRAAEELGDAYPLPSMVLGVTGRRGNTPAEIADALRRGRASDATRPEGAYWFVSTDNVRTRTRAGQVGPAAEALRAMGAEVVEADRFPRRQERLLGVMTGAAIVNPGQENHYVPGAIGDHLTSFAGAFDAGGQTPLTEWIRAGATASSGTVVEPLALWTKFPHAWVFVAQRQGATMLESFAATVACPLQLLLVGDPLARPWGSPLAARIEGGPEAWRFVVEPDPGEAFAPRVRAWVDGRPVEPGRLPPDLAQGAHELRAEGVLPGLLRPTLSAQAEWFVPGPRAPDLTATRQTDGDWRLTVRLGAPPKRLVARNWGRIAAEASPGRGTQEFRIARAAAGLGPWRWQVEAHWPDGTVTRSLPRRFEDSAGS